MTVLFAAVCVVAGTVLVGYGLAERLRLRAESLGRLLEAELAEPSVSPDRLTDLMERAGAFADRALSGTNIIRKVQVMLAQAGWSLRPGEFAACLAVGTLALCGLAWAFTASRTTAMILAVVAPLGTVAWMDVKGKRRAMRVETQLPAILQLLAGSLESGSSILHSLELAATEGQEPLASEFARVVAETRVGRPFVESLAAMSGRVGSRDLEWTVEAIRIQHVTGGKLADTLRVLADFMRARLEVRGEVSALSAEARLSAKVLTALPLLVGAYLFAFRFSYVAPLVQTHPGRLMLAMGAGGVALATVWMRRIVRVEV